MKISRRVFVLTAFLCYDPAVGGNAFAGRWQDGVMTTKQTAHTGGHPMFLQDSSVYAALISLPFDGV